MARLTVRAHPRASRNRLQLEPDNTVSVWVTAPPIGNRANEALCQLLARRLRVAPSSIRIVLGPGRPIKVMEIQGLTSERIRELLARPGEDGRDGGKPATDYP